MFTAAALVSSPPLLVPELSGAAAVETAELRRASAAAAGRLAELTRHWTIVGVGAADARYGPDTVGTFAGFGVDVRVALRAGAGGPADPSLPLPLLVGGWLRGAVDGTAPAAHGSATRGSAAADVVADGFVIAADTPADRCAEYGALLRRALDADPDPRGVLVVADGANTLTARAPGAYDDRAPGVQCALDRALAGGDVEFLARLDQRLCADLGIAGRAAWQVLAGLFAAAPRDCSTAYQGAPYGVGYHVGMWLP